MTAAVLGVLAVLLSGPAPALLARFPGVRRTPRAAMVLWQALALAAVLAALGAPLALVTSNAFGPGRSWLEYAVAGLALVVTAVVAGRLALTGHLVGTRLRAMRRRHRELLDLTASPERGVLVLEGAEPVAYCVPGVARRRVVLSRGATDSLGEAELAAVVAHERAHLNARHDLVLEAFTVLHQAFPRWVSSARALGEVRLLTEILADAASRRRHGALPLARALVALTEADLAPAAGGHTVLAAAVGPSQLAGRIELLRDDRGHRPLAVALLAAAAAVLVLPTVFVAYPWLSSLAS